MRDKKEFLTCIIIELLICLIFTIKVHAAIPTDVIQAIQNNETTDLTKEEIDTLAHLVKAEAGNQTFLGKQLVVDVVLNRMRSELFPDTVSEVIYSPSQFACSDYFMNKKPSQEDYDAVYTEIECRQNREVIYFRTKHYGSGTLLFKEDAHYFSGL